MNKPTEVACPQCSKKVIWSTANTYRPFCSERCKLMDLGQWATGGYSIPVTDNFSSESINTVSSSDENLM
ncbi:MAG: DNA gyrase inhibitor YacG [Candidatus Nitrotoga sp.]